MSMDRRQFLRGGAAAAVAVAAAPAFAQVAPSKHRKISPLKLARKLLPLPADQWAIKIEEAGYDDNQKNELLERVQKELNHVVGELPRLLDGSWEKAAKGRPYDNTAQAKNVLKVPELIKIVTDYNKFLQNNKGKLLNKDGTPRQNIIDERKRVNDLIKTTGQELQEKFKKAIFSSELLNETPIIKAQHTNTPKPVVT